jgi:hypothetical protein
MYVFIYLSFISQGQEMADYTAFNGKKVNEKCIEKDV